MEVGVLERLLRELPGVLDCSVTDEGVAIVVHPEVDPRVIELRAKALLGEVDETKPLLVVGGMTSGAPVMSPPERRARARGGRSPLSATGVVVLVLALLFVVPITGRDASSDRDLDTPATTPPAELAAPLSSPAPALPAAVPVIAETVPAVTPPAPSAPGAASVVAAPAAAPVAEPLVALAAEEAEVPVTVTAAAVVGSPSFEVVKLKKKHARADKPREREPTTKATSGKSGRRKATGLRKR